MTETILPSQSTPEKLSLKEAVLYRKLRKDQKQSPLHEQPNRQPSVGAVCPAAEDRESKANPDEIRSKLLKNRQKLDQLLQEAPTFLKSKQNSEKGPVEVLKSQATNPPLNFYEAAETTQNASDESSSDEEIKKPVDDTPLQLTDEDEILRACTSQNDRSDSSKENKLFEISQTKSEMFVRSSRNSLLREKQASVTSSSGSLYYEIAKPKPPPRAQKSKNNTSYQQIDLDPKEAKSILLRDNTTRAKSSINGDQSEIENKRSSGVEEHDVIKPADNLQTENAGYITGPETFFSKQTSDTSLSRMLAKSDSPSNVYYSSGYYSSKSGSTSLSSSNSNASSTTSSLKFHSSRSSQHSQPSPKSAGSVTLSPSNSDASATSTSIPLKYRSERSSQHSQTSQKSAGSTTLSPSNSDVSTTSTSKSLKYRSGRLSQHSQTSQASAKDEEQKLSDQIENDPGLKLNPKDDIFPVRSWMESAEYASLTKQNRNESFDNATSNDVNDVSSSTDLFVRPSKPAPKHPMTRRPAVINSISMVEQPQNTEVRNRNRILPNGVKIRIPGNRTKKNDASRNSRAFALQMKQLSEKSGSPILGERIAPNAFPCLDNRSNNVIGNPRPLKSFPVQDLAHLKRDLSGSLNNISRSSSSTEKRYGTVSGATGRHLSATSSTFDTDNNDDYGNFTEDRRNKPQEFNRASTISSYEGSTWSLNPTSTDEGFEKQERRRKLSISSRLKGAFSFQNIRKAISMERLNEEEKMRSLSHSYLNEFGEDISQSSRQRSNANASMSDAPPPGRLNKAPSISSIFSTVRMRKRKSRERRAAKARNTIAVDPSDIPEYECSSDPNSSTNSSVSTKVSSPGHIRPIGRVLEVNVKEGTLLVEMEKPDSGPFSFYIARRKETGNVYITSLSDAYPKKMYAGLMKLGDEITEVNGSNVHLLTLDEIYNIIFDNKKLVLRIKPSQVHIV